MEKQRLAVHKFTSCDGCQLAILKSGEKLLMLSEFVDIVHFAEAGVCEPDAKVNIAIIEGSISTPVEEQRIQQVRANSQYLITIGACATAGGIQALRNHADGKQWMAAVYPEPKFIKTLSTSTSIAEHVRVDLELWGCPVTSKQIFDAIRDLLFGVSPTVDQAAVCMECKRQGNICVLVTKAEPCLGPVTVTGCGAICPAVSRECYGCFGPKENPNPQSLGKWFQGLGFNNEDIARRFWQINTHAPEFEQAGAHFKGIKIVSQKN